VREGFAGTVAVPAWARFMRSATKGSKADWYRMPRDVEKVAICRLSGERAGPSCRDAPLAAERYGAFTSPSPLIDAKYPPEPALAPVGALPPAEPLLYEDLFPIGAIPSETCRRHDAAFAAHTPMVDGVLRQTSLSDLPLAGPAIRSSSRLYVEREPRGDGTYRTVIRQRP
jgi:hypothetical protein